VSDDDTRDPSPEPSVQGSPNWSTHLAQLASEDPGPRRRELRRLAEETRRLIHAMVMTDADEATLTEAADAVASVAERFTPTAGRSIFEGFGEAATSGNPHGFFDHSPMLGVANPIAPPIVMQSVDDRTMEGIVTFGAAYEGPPGCVHGGFIAAAFDEVLGAVQSLSAQPGMTGTLTVRFRSPTPLHEPLRFTGHWDRVEGRKVLTSGTLHAGERLCAEAEGIFISVDFSKMTELRAQRAERQEKRSTD